MRIAFIYGFNKLLIISSVRLSDGTESHFVQWSETGNGSSISKCCRFYCDIDYMMMLIRLPICVLSCRLMTAFNCASYKCDSFSSIIFCDFLGIMTFLLASTHIHPFLEFRNWCACVVQANALIQAAECELIHMDYNRTQPKSETNFVTCRIGYFNSQNRIDSYSTIGMCVPIRNRFRSS